MAAHLFKYLPPVRLDVLRKGRIRFSQASALNDPGEFKPLLSALGKRTDLEVIAAEAVKDAIREGKGKLRPFDVFITDSTYSRCVELIAPHLPSILESPFVLGHITKAFESFDRQIGVLSLSEAPDDARMWTVYAQRGEGFVIHFDGDHQWFRRGAPHGIEPKRKVRYVDVRSPVLLLELSIEELFLTKTREWEHEREWRMIRRLTEASERFTVDGSSVYLFDVPAECVLSVRLGRRMTEDSKAQIREILGRPDYSHVVIEPNS